MKNHSLLFLVVAGAALCSLVCLTGCSDTSTTADTAMLQATTTPQSGGSGEPARDPLSNSTPPAGFASNGTPPDGTIQNGTPPDDTMFNGTPPDGRIPGEGQGGRPMPNGTPPDGMMPPGTPQGGMSRPA